MSGHTNMPIPRGDGAKVSCHGSRWNADEGKRRRFDVFFSNLDFSQPWVGIAYTFTLQNCMKLGASIPHQEEVGTNKQILSCKCSSQCCLFE